MSGRVGVGVYVNRGGWTARDNIIHRMTEFENFPDEIDIVGWLMERAIQGGDTPLPIGGLAKFEGFAKGIQVRSDRGVSASREETVGAI